MGLLHASFGLKKTEKAIFLSYFHERSLDEIIWAGFKILNQNWRKYLTQEMFFRFTGKLNWETSSDERTRGRALAIPLA